MHGLVHVAHAALPDFGENLISAADESSHSPFVSVGERAAVTRAMRVVCGESRIAGRTLFHAGHPPADVRINIHGHGGTRRVCSTDFGDNEEVNTRKSWTFSASRRPNQTAAKASPHPRLYSPPARESSRPFLLA